MKNFVPDTYIVCENCYRHFVKYIHIHTQIDADDLSDVSTSFKDNTINRVRCPYCNVEFTYEAPVFVYSQTRSYAVISGFPDKFVNISSVKRAFEISGVSDWKLRRCTFTSEASEKARLFEAGLSDAITELIKLRLFPQYKDMHLDEEYIVYEKSDGENLVFSHRDFANNLIDSHQISLSEYSLMCDVNIPRGAWMTIDRDWAINFMEDTKK